MKINSRLNEIEKIHGRVQKSNFTIAHWIHMSQHLVYIHTHKYPNKEILYTLYQQKHDCIKAMIKSGMNKYKLYCKDEDESKWLIVLNQKLQGVEFNVVIPYGMVKNDINIDHIELTDVNRDCLYIDGREDRRFMYKVDKKLRFTLDNMEKSRLKMLEKLDALVK